MLKKSNFTSKTKILMILVMVGLLVSAVYSGVCASAQGEKLIDMQNQEYELEAQNQDLSTQIVAGQSLSQVGQEAQKAGFAMPSNFIYINFGSLAAR